MLDLDRAWPGGGPGEGVSASRPPNGLFLHLGPLCDCALILSGIARSSRGIVRVFSYALVIVYSAISVDRVQVREGNREKRRNFQLGRAYMYVQESWEHA